MALGLNFGILEDTDDPPVLNGYSVNFQGDDEFMSTGGADTNLADKTYTFWAKSSATSATEKNTIFSHGGSHKGGFHFNWSSSRPLLYLGTSYYRFWQDVASGAQDDGAWHFWTVVVDVSDVTGSLLYVDAVLQTADTDATTFANVQAYEGIQLGRDASGGNHFTGNIDEFCVFDGHLSSSQILLLYGTGTPTTSPKVVAQPGQLEHWWRLGDQGGTGTFIPDHANLGVGAETVTNGGFDADANWTKGTGWEIDDGVASCDGTQSANTGLVQQGTIEGGSLDFAVGEVYEVTFDAVVTAGVITYVEVGSGLDSVDITSSGHVVRYISVTSTNDRLTIAGSATFVGSVDNVSVKQVNGKPGTLQSGAVIQTDSP